VLLDVIFLKERCHGAGRGRVVPDQKEEPIEHLCRAGEDIKRGHTVRRKRGVRVQDTIKTN